MIVWFDLISQSKFYLKPASLDPAKYSVVSSHITALYFEIALKRKGVKESAVTLT